MFKKSSIENFVKQINSQNEKPKKLTNKPNNQITKFHEIRALDR